MDWMARARREIPECAKRRTAVTAVGGLSAVLAVHSSGRSRQAEPSFGSSGSAVGLRALDPEALHEEFVERAAILEFDGGLSRDEAERRAWEIVVIRHTVH